jgi:hypothetical protein
VGITNSFSTHTRSISLPGAEPVVLFEQGLQHRFAGGRAAGVGLLHQGIGLLAAELPGQFPPERADGLFAALPA